MKDIITLFTSERRSVRKRALRNLLRPALLLTASVLAIIILSAVFGSFKADAHEKAGSDDIKLYESHFIEPGETLWSIASAHVDGIHYTSEVSYIREVHKLNNFKGERINAGEYIILPYYKDDTDVVLD